MPHKRPYAVAFIKTLSFVLDIAAFYFSVFLTALAVSHFDMYQGFHLGDIFRTHTISFALATCLLAVFLLSGEYQKRKPLWEQIFHVVKFSCIMLAIDVITRSAANYGQPSVYPMFYWPISLALLVVFRFALNIIKTKIDGWKIPAVIIGDVNMVTHVLYAIASDQGMGYDPKRVLMRGDVDKRFDPEEAPAMYRDIKLRDGRDGYEDFILENLDQHFIISMETFRGEERDHLLRLLRNHDVKFSLVPMISQMSLYQADPLYFFGHDVMFIETKRFKLSLFERFMKRTIDVIGSMVGLLILGLPMLIIAAKLRAESPDEPVFYGGIRVGQDQSEFRCWKFRTMASNSDHLLHAYLDADPEAKAYWDRFLKLLNDPRVCTRMTRFIRNKSIDELPQLWNVLKGDMSLVGPRPILPNEIELYGDPIKYYETLRPGITGIWQVSGRSEASFKRRVVWDIWYVRNWSLWGDIVITIKTILVVICGKGAT